MSFSVYVLKSLKNGKRYVGYTSKEVSIRLQEHLTGSNQWTRQNGPFVLVHSEAFGDKASAQSREKFLKSGVGRQWLDSVIGK